MEKVTLEGVFISLTTLIFSCEFLFPRFPHVYASITYGINSGTID
jgi:hypothetical protein